jgi:co-chaperonin GroES (HSP10)
MKIQPLKDIIMIKVNEVSVGGLDTSSKASAIEFGEVIAVGPDQKQVKVGDKIMFKSWAVDLINYEDKVYEFINPETGGIMAICK